MPTRAEALAILTGPAGPFAIGTADIGGQTLRVYSTAPGSLRDVWVGSERHGDVDFLVFQDQRITYTEAHRQVRTLVAHLAAGGVGRGDRVAIAMRNYPEWVLSFWAVQSLGAVVVSMNAWWTGSESEYGLSDSGATALLADGERYERVRGEILDRLEIALVVVVRPEAALDTGHVTWSDVMTGPDPAS